MSENNKHNRHPHPGNEDVIEKSMEAHEKEHEREHTRNLNKLWLWLGVLVLVALLLWWIFSIGFFEDTTGVTNFGN